MRSRDYRIRTPHDTTIVAACEDAGCDQWRSGWETVCDESTETGALVAAWIRSGQSGRDYLELGGTPCVFRFAPHQRCFNEHRTRPARLLVTANMNPRAILREHVSLADLAEDYTEHMGQVATDRERM
jgi:hypothetical protein